jgi:hypothetical protein
MRLASPVIEVAGDNQRVAVRHFGVNEAAQLCDLPGSVPLPKTKVYADRMQILLLPRHIQNRMEHPAAFSATAGYVSVLVTHYRKLRKQCVAVVPGGIDGVLSVGETFPDRICEKLVLGFLGPPFVTSR